MFEDHRTPQVVLDAEIGDASELAELRHRASSACVDELAPVGDDVALCVSELVTNALLHGEQPIHVVLCRSDASVTVAVSDHARRTPQLVLSSSHVGGRGLRIVDALSQRWGMEFGNDGKTVWATLHV
jgi:hypothetical protein